MCLANNTLAVCMLTYRAVRSVMSEKQPLYDNFSEDVFDEYACKKITWQYFTLNRNKKLCKY